MREIPGHLESWDSRQGEVEMGWQALQGEPSAPRSPCGSTLASLDRAGRWAAPPSSDPTMAGPGALYSPGKGGLSMAAGPRPVLAPSPWGHPLDARSPAFPPPPFPPPPSPKASEPVFALEKELVEGPFPGATGQCSLPARSTPGQSRADRNAVFVPVSVPRVGLQQVPAKCLLVCSINSQARVPLALARPAGPMHAVACVCVFVHGRALVCVST